MRTTRPARFASAGRDRHVLIWDWDPMGEDDPHPWKVSTEGLLPFYIRRCTKADLFIVVACKDNPECIKYRPGSSLLAIQCNDG